VRDRNIGGLLQQEGSTLQCAQGKWALHHGERSQTRNHQGPARGSEGDWDDLLICWKGSGGTVGDHLHHSQGTGLQRPGTQSHPCGQGSHHASSFHHTRDCKLTGDPSWRPGGPSVIGQGGGTGPGVPTGAATTATNPAILR
jgi:hypothetical protein